jgi:hypothetical protein
MSDLADKAPQFAADLRRTGNELRRHPADVDLASVIRAEEERYWLEADAFAQVAAEAAPLSAAGLELQLETFAFNHLRTMEELRRSSDIDLQAVVTAAAEEYRITRERTRHSPRTAAPVDEIAAMATFLAKASGELQPTREDSRVELGPGTLTMRRTLSDFWSEFLIVGVTMVAISTALAMLTDVSSTFSASDLLSSPWIVSREHSSFGGTVLMLVLIAATVIVYLIRTPGLRAYAAKMGGAVGATVLLAIYGIAIADVREKFDSSEKLVSNSAMLTLLQNPQDTRQLAIAMSPDVRIQRATTGCLAELISRPAGLDVDIVACLSDTTNARLEWRTAAKTTPRGQLVVGNVTSVGKGMMTVSNGGQDFAFPWTANLVIPVGSRVLADLGPDHLARSIVTIPETTLSAQAFHANR